MGWSLSLKKWFWAGMVTMCFKKIFKMATKLQNYFSNNQDIRYSILFSCQQCFYQIAYVSSGTASSRKCSCTTSTCWASSSGSYASWLKTNTPPASYGRFLKLLETTSRFLWSTEADWKTVGWIPPIKWWNFRDEVQ